MVACSANNVQYTNMPEKTDGYYLGTKKKTTVHTNVNKTSTDNNNHRGEIKKYLHLPSRTPAYTNNS
jgi:hypothetical protein